MSFRNMAETHTQEAETNAPIGEVWKALADGNALARWFPLEARVTPGLGGKIFVSWGPAYEGEAEILGWEPGKSLPGKTRWDSSNGHSNPAAEKPSCICYRADSSATPTGKTSGSIPPATAGASCCSVCSLLLNAIQELHSRSHAPPQSHSFARRRLSQTLKRLAHSSHKTRQPH